MIADVALSVVPKEKSGMAAGINDTFRQVGVAVGVAAWGAIFLGTGASKVESLTGGTVDHDQARGLVEATSSGALPEALRGIPANARDSVRNAAEQGFLHGLNEILMLGGILCLVGTASPSGWCASGRSTAARSAPAPTPRSRPSRSPPGLTRRRPVPRD